MELLALPAFDDNYIWMLHNGQYALVVDPGDATPVASALQTRGLQLAGILVTHHHGDHVGGIEALRPLLQGAVYGPARERIPAPFTPVHGGETARLLDLEFQVIDVPGHTAGHIAYFLPAQQGQAPLLFCGDTLFSGGCGRLFEGTPAQMHASLTALADLPGDTRVCCAHEYTLSNLRFAAAVEPGNEALRRYRQWCEDERARGGITLPSTIERERAINPFLRCAQPAVAAAARQRDPAAVGDVPVLAALREWKNDFR